MTESTLIAFADAVQSWFPELGGRAFAVANATVTKENIPTLPVAMVVLVGDKPNHMVKTGRVELADQISLEFWFKPERYKREDGSESPFWAFYDYEPIRDRLIRGVIGWKSPRGYKLRYDGVEVNAFEFGVSIIFRLTHAHTFCDESGEDVADGGAIGTVDFSMCPRPAPACI